MSKINNNIVFVWGINQRSEGMSSLIFVKDKYPNVKFVKST